MELFVFGRMRALEGQEEAIAAELRLVTPPSRGEAGNVAVEMYRSAQDPREFRIYSRWVDDEAFEVHSKMPHTVRFADQVKPLLESMDLTLSRPL